MVFFLINSPILAIAGFVVNSVIDPDNSILPPGVTKNLNWFSQNPDLSHNIVLGLYIAAGLFALFAIYNIAAAAWDNGSDRDA